MATKRDALSLLPVFQWRGKKYPIESSRHSFRHDTAEHKVSYGGITLMEPLGPQNPTFQYVIPMDQGIARGPYQDLIKEIPNLAHDMYDRTPGPLVDPLYGQWTCLPLDFSSDLEARRRSGVPITVSFTWAPDLDTDVRRVGGVDTVSGLASDAGALDEAVTKLFRRHDTAARPPSINPLDLVASVAGTISHNIEKVQAQLKAFTAKVEATEAAVDKLINQTRDPDAFGVKREARRIRRSAIRTQKELVALTQDVGTITIAQQKNLLTIAAEEGMTIKELLSLNASLAKSPIVAAGTTVQVLKAKAA